MKSNKGKKKADEPIPKAESQRSLQEILDSNKKAATAPDEQAESIFGRPTVYSEPIEREKKEAAAAARDKARWEIDIKLREVTYQIQAISEEFQRAQFAFTLPEMSQARRRHYDNQIDTLYEKRTALLRERERI
ncbi:hypothetical protein HII31_07738 [Pseudocercospora fuligena]|uniref:Uncharacterized protein n=1 Tax=Pseudocercospora fuligena TaxID=685502 RepID=A0A8H6RGL3_9PEZI|nr:hypothetical protein HII31_07738 [Pseudocercospora fuligena]